MTAKTGDRTVRGTQLVLEPLRGRRALFSVTTFLIASNLLVAGAMLSQDGEIGREFGCLVAPVGQQTGRPDHEARQVRATTRLFEMQMGQGLHRLTQTHIVGQNPGQAILPEKLQPVQAGLLIGSQGCVESFRRQALLDAGIPREAM